MKVLRLLFYLSIVAVIGVSTTFAKVCPPGKVGATIVNPANKIIELCIPEAAVDNIGGSGDVVIPGSCPCYSQDDLDAFWADPNFLINLNNLSKIGRTRSDAICTQTLFYNVEDYDIGFLASEGPPNYDICQWGEWEGGEPPSTWQEWVPYNNMCFYKNGSNWSIIHSLSEADGDACMAILNSFLPK